jgi:CBS domain-containing protein
MNNTTIDRPSERALPFEEATVADVMSRGVIHCTPETPLRAVARLMTTHTVHAVFVLDYGSEADETPELWGMISDLDVAAAACGDIDACTAARSAVSPLQTVTSDEPLTIAAQAMAFNGLAHLAVLDPGTRRPIGVLSTLDVARAVAASEP